ncbi:Fc.00g040660.m01.CDS01 [Cosmosporella sp. VM-42]
MAGISHNTGMLPGLGNPGDSPANARPPPSTLAAQLVENISASTKSSKSDENSELKGFFAIIQRVKDDPQLLKTPDERVEHNHMLIYAYSRVVLEGIKFDDPFFDRTHVRTEALKALNFLRFTIKETPRVLQHETAGGEFLFRGPEPLWMWLFPQLLRLLGHSQCIELCEDIESLIQYFLLVVAQTGALWDLAPAIIFYLRTTLKGILSHLQDGSLVSKQEDTIKVLNLPPQMTLDQVLGRCRHSTTPRITYQIDRISQAIQQARSLANILMYPLISGEAAIEALASYSENSLWLVDTLLDIRGSQRRWIAVSPLSPVSVIEMTLRLIKGLSKKKNAVFALRDKAIALLVILCGEIASSSNGLVTLQLSPQEDQRTYCAALLMVAQVSMHESSISRLAGSKLMNELVLQSLSIPEHTDIWRTIQTLKHITTASPPQLLDERAHPAKFQDENIKKGIASLSLKYEGPEETDEGRAKRRKISSQESDAKSSLLDLIYDTLKISPPDEGVIVFDEVFMDGFQKAEEPTQCLAIDLLSRTCCLTDNMTAAPGTSPPRARDFNCLICDIDSTTLDSVPSAAISSKSEAQLILAKLIRSAPLLTSRRPRVAAMIALRRLVLHSNDPDTLNLETSVLGQWCLQSLNSSVRELRIAAGRTLATFMIQRPKSQSIQDLVHRNRKNSITLLRSISEKGQANLVETCIMAWGQLGRVVTEYELNLVLIKLLEYLGNSNSIVSAFAFNELLALAEARGVAPRHLFKPYWPSLAYMATKDMVHRPQMSRAIAELLSLSVNELLLLIQTHALPWLVLDKQKGVIQKIAEARQEKEIWQPVMEGRNMAAIVAHLLVQDTEDPKGFTESRLIELHPHFRKTPLLELLQSEPVLIAMELLKAAGEADESQKPPVRKALHIEAAMILAANKEPKQKKGNPIGRFLAAHLLGLMARLTDVINDSLSNSSALQEQRRCIRAMEEMIWVCKEYARMARPQISACLLSTLSQDALREASISCWAAMLTHFEEEDVESLLETTFFIVNRYWATMSGPAIAIARQMLNLLVDRYEAIISKYISKLPSLHHVPEFSQIESKLKSLRPTLLVEDAFEVFSERISHENSGVVLQALEELVPYLESNQTALHTSAVSEQPDTTITSLMRALLDCACKYSDIQADISRLCTQSMGLIGCLDSNKIEAVREQRTIVVLNNFAPPEEATDFALFLLEMVLVPSFLSATDVKLQGFLAFAIQQLLEKSDVKAACAMEANGIIGGNDIYRKWIALPETIREIVRPFMTSRYMVAPMEAVKVEFPIFRPGRSYGFWLKTLVVELLRKPQTRSAALIFEPLTRVIRVKDITIAEFLLPYVVLHILIGQNSTQKERDNVLGELMSILQHQPAENASYEEKEDMKRCCHAVFRVVDYAMRWIQAKRSKGGLTETDKQNLSRIQEVLDTIPAELISQRAIDCNEYSRALFHLEQHAQKMEQRKREPGERTRLLERLQDIYANIDEPDGLDGISSHLHVLDINHQILSHRKAGRWTAVQSWYEMQLTEKPDNLDVQLDLLHCLKQAGQHDVLLNHIEGMQIDSSTDNKIMPFAVEAAWVTGRWGSLAKFKDRFHGDILQDFNVSLATIFQNLRENRNPEELTETIKDMREKISSSMNSSATTSLQACHELLLKCHVLTDLEIIIGLKVCDEGGHKRTMALLDRRLEIIGAYFNDKQYLLGIRRAAMELKRPAFTDFDISGVWLSSAKLARKSNSLHQSFNAVLHASRLGDDAATIENAKLLWIDGHHRKAIQMLQGAIQRNKFMTQTGTSTNTGASKMNSHQRLLTARAQLLLAKWLDNAGQTHAGALREKYQQPPKTYSTWEKGHYYLGRHYKKILESEKPLKVDDQSDNYVTGEIARLVIENYVRSLNSGTKYLYQTLPRILTLWLDLGAQVDKAPEGKVSLSRELHRRRVEQLNLLHSFLDKYIQRLPAFIFYTALPQIVARIAHPNPNVFDRLTHIVVKVVEAHPRQALWSLIGIMTTKQVSERKARGTQILQALRSQAKKVEGSNYDMKYLLRMGEKLAEQLLLACQNGEFHSNKTVHASLLRDLRFNHKCTPCPLVVPVESSLTATLPAVSEYVKKHKAFSRDVVTIDSFLDDVLVLSSLAKPRRLTARGTDGKNYMLLIKPKDDLRTDQRLMEFNGIINRSLKRDAESSRRQLYIRTYAVTPLNEECGIIEWVPGIKTMRDILINLYASRKIYPDYVALRQLMDEASISDSKIRIFTDDVLGRFPPMLHLWFTQQFPNPSAWFAARLRYTRSCAVMSMVGTILGLGDRHGENVNLEEGNGGVFHVDFNCLFDKGLTFAKPERVPFRLTHNMVAAMGIYGYEGPFRKSCELTLSSLRQQEETLMTILEAFIYDPTLDLQKEKRAHRRGDVGVKLQPQSVVDSIKRKVKGLLPTESIPLGVEGQVEELIKQAVDPRNLAAMYIGWCPFL